MYPVKIVAFGESTFKGYHAIENYPADDPGARSGTIGA